MQNTHPAHQYGVWCDLLVGGRGPPYTDTSQIKNWKLPHIRFIEPGTAGPDAPNWWRGQLDKFPHSAPAGPTKYVGIEGTNPPKPSMMPAAIRLSVMLKLGKVITPKTDFVTLTLEKCSVKDMTWCEPFQEMFSLWNEKFASGTFHNAYGEMHCQEFSTKVCIEKDEGKPNLWHWGVVL